MDLLFSLPVWPGYAVEPNVRKYKREELNILPKKNALLFSLDWKAVVKSVQSQKN